jgi:hypothetical protein
MIVGYESWFGRFIINPIIRSWIFTDDMGYAWLQHNIEEVGNFEFFLSDLFQCQTDDPFLQVK